MTGMKLRSAEAARLHSAAGREITMTTGKENMPSEREEAPWK